ncbi:DUF4906 domain-containing protein [uncultured Parabacteroides sp.]|uniref:DUF4906 domain-containing protein n=1 Tax=uncultured Parabacteroides sp. TaxID=512312 RepID=UPI0025DF2F9D|nr:DUF4906 domain-containing protein [uncultured Parabacteroides sp.]
MTVAIISMLMSGCEDRFDSRGGASSRKEQAVDVTLAIGLADEVDGYDLSAAPVAKGGSSEAFDTRLVSAVRTKAAVNKPDKLYNLEIVQYDASGAKIQNMGTTSTITSAELGSKLTVTLQSSDNCQLLIVARGADAAIPSIISKSNIRNIRKDKDMLVDAIGSKINAVGFGGDASMNNMPYFLYLESVKVGANGEIQSLEGQNLDVRLLLKRLAVRLDVAWSVSEQMKSNGYELKEVRLSQVPVSYRLLPDEEETQWGKAYPVATAEFADLYRLKDTELTTANGKQSVWLPANVRGTSPAATSLYYRNKQNAPTASSYLEFVVDNAGKQERLYYRVYLGGPRTTDFNLYGNTDYSYIVNINNANHETDARIQLLDQTPVISTNLVPSANCFMMEPGTMISFNPYKHTSGTSGWNDELVATPSGTPAFKTEIKKVKVLWQNKDSGTSGELVMGYAIGTDDHSNLVNLTNGNDINQARVHVRVPVTHGGNALIAAYGTDETKALWSWHIWVSDYVPATLGSFTPGDAANRANAIKAAQEATRGGIVQVYGGVSWTETDGAFYKTVIMDRNLGAIRAGIQNNNLDAARTFGLLYQGGRKDPFYSSADGTLTQMKTIYDWDGEGTDIIRAAKNPNIPYQSLIENPKTFYPPGGGKVLYNDKSNTWGTNNTKTIYDPCPDGWKVPTHSATDPKQSLCAGFGSTGSSTIYEDQYGDSDNVMYYNGSTLTSMKSNGGVSKNGTDIPGSGFLYFGGSGEKQNAYTEKSPFFPGVSLREVGDGEYRTSVKNNAVFLWTSVSEKTGYRYIYQIQNGKFSFKHSVEDGYGFSVRCVQDKGF